MSGNNAFAFGVGCCCGGCTICEMNDGDPSGCGFSIVAGSGSVSDNNITFDASNSLALASSSAAAGTIAEKVQALVSFGFDGDVFRVFAKRADANNYWFAQLTLGSGGTLKLFERAGGASTQRGSVDVNAPDTDQYILALCYGGGRVTASVSSNSSGVRLATINYSTATINSTDHGAGVAVGAISDVAAFQNFSYEYGYDATAHPTCLECEPPACADQCCNGGAFPGQLDITLPNDWSNGTFAGCVFGGTTYTLASFFSQTYCLGSTISTMARWHYYDPNIGTIGGTPVQLLISAEISCNADNVNKCYMGVQITLCTSSTEYLIYTGVEEFNRGVDCSNTTWTIPEFFTFTGPGGGFGWCNYSDSGSATIVNH